MFVTCKELSYGRIWNEDPRFYALMAELKFGYVFISDLILSITPLME